MSEQRAHPRIRESARVEIKIIAASELPEFERIQFFCQTSDISLRGARIQTEVFLPVESYLTVDIVLSQSSVTYSHRGRVAWCRENESSKRKVGTGYEAGIEFDKDGLQYEEWRSAIFLLMGNNFMKI